MTNRIYNVLILCTCNTARSIIAEALINQMGKGHFRAWSGGRTPKGSVHPLALALLEKAGNATTGLRSKSWNEFAAPDAPEMDFIISVCDSLANEPCPVWQGHPLSAQWHFADPTLVVGSEAEQLEAFERTFHEIMMRVNLFVNLPTAMLDRTAIHHEIQKMV